MYCRLLVVLDFLLALPHRLHLRSFAYQVQIIFYCVLRAEYQYL